jgi:hypothetical protein
LLRIGPSIRNACCSDRENDGGHDTECAHVASSNEAVSDARPTRVARHLTPVAEGIKQSVQVISGNRSRSGLPVRVPRRPERCPRLIRGYRPPRRRSHHGTARSVR